MSISPSIPSNAIYVYTDGACSGNPGPAGIGIFFKHGNHEKEISKAIGSATNNIAELKAIKLALETIKKKNLPVRIFTDSRYSIGVLDHGWKARANKELIADIKKLMSGFNDLEFIKVKAHVGVENNEKADRLARLGVKNSQQLLKTAPTPSMGTI
ncbi:ribonuclease HI [Candidatus Magnetomoraceae bacterium gMMP-1]